VVETDEDSIITHLGHFSGLAFCLTRHAGSNVLLSDERMVERAGLNS